MKSIIRKAREWVLKRPDNMSFSQSGEDRIVKFIFDVIGIEKPSYLDIGTHHPCQLSNTYLFYLLGGRGVLVDPNIKWRNVINKKRADDIFLNVGLGREERKGVPFYVMSSDTLCTFSGEEAARMEKECNQKIMEVREIDILVPSMVINRYFNDKPNYISLDVEGLEMDILRSIDFDKGRPEVFCIETISYSITGEGIKNKELIDYMKNEGYMEYADTYINTIFVDKDVWMRQK